VKGLKLGWGQVAEAGVAAPRVVPGLDPLEDRRSQLGPGCPGAGVEKFALHRRPERFEHGVVDAGGGPAHRAERAGGAQAVAEDPGAVRVFAVRGYVAVSSVRVEGRDSVPGRFLGEGGAGVLSRGSGRRSRDVGGCERFGWSVPPWGRAPPVGGSLATGVHEPAVGAFMWGEAEPAQLRGRGRNPWWR